MIKKGAVSIDTLIKIVAILIVLVVFLVVVVPKFSQMIFQAGEKGECQWNVLVSALTRTPGLGFENIPVECKAQYLNVSKSEIMGYFPEASSAIATYARNPSVYKDIYKIFPKDSGTDKDKLAEWAMDKFIADEMISCWDKVWRGDLPLFDVWYKLIGLECGKASCSATDYLKIWNDKLEIKRPPVFCVVCSRIQFNKDLGDYSTLRQSVDLSVWMAANRVPRTKISYYEYLLPDWLKGKPYNPNYVYSAKEPYAVVYQRVNAHQTLALASDIGALLGLAEDVPNKWDRIALVPYRSVILPFGQGGANCDYVID